MYSLSASGKQQHELLSSPYTSSSSPRHSTPVLRSGTLAGGGGGGGGGGTSTWNSGSGGSAAAGTTASPLKPNCPTAKVAPLLGTPSRLDRKEGGSTLVRGKERGEEGEGKERGGGGRGGRERGGEGVDWEAVGRTDSGATREQQRSLARALKQVGVISKERRGGGKGVEGLGGGGGEVEGDIQQWKSLLAVKDRIIAQNNQYIERCVCVCVHVTCTCVCVVHLCVYLFCVCVCVFVLCVCVCVWLAVMLEFLHLSWLDD